MTYYNREGERITVEEWQRLLRQDDYRCVAQTTVTSQDDDVDYVVSTAWLGIDCGTSRVDGAPFIFETLVFSGDDKDGQGDRRYSSEVAALEGHAEVVSVVASTVPAAHVDNGGQGWFGP